MENILFTFPVFYHCVMKNACKLQQYKSVNILLKGYWREDDVTCISPQLVSRYTSGNKPLTKELANAFLNLSEEEIITRLQELQFYDVSSAATALRRLLEHPSIDPALKRSLTDTESYPLLCRALRYAVANTSHTADLTKAQETLTFLASLRTAAAEAPSAFGSVRDTLRVRKWADCKKDTLWMAETFFYEQLCAQPTAAFLYTASSIPQKLKRIPASSCYILECSGELAAVEQYIKNLPELRQASIVMDCLIHSEHMEWDALLHFGDDLLNIVRDSLAPGAAYAPSRNSTQDPDTSRVRYCLLLAFDPTKEH